MGDECMKNLSEAFAKKFPGKEHFVAGLSHVPGIGHIDDLYYFILNVYDVASGGFDYEGLVVCTTNDGLEFEFFELRPIK